MPVEYMTPAIEDRAVEVLTLLADRGQHRAPSVPDLIIAATAELAGLTVLHLDKDFDVIADVTGQSVERLNVKGRGEAAFPAEGTRPPRACLIGRRRPGRSARRTPGPGRRRPGHRSRAPAAGSPGGPSSGSPNRAAESLMIGVPGGFRGWRTARRPSGPWRP